MANCHQGASGYTAIPQRCHREGSVVQPAGSSGGGAYLAMARGWNRLGALTSPLRLTAETATTSGGVPLQVCEPCAPGETALSMPARARLHQPEPGPALPAWGPRKGPANPRWANPCTSFS